MIDAVLSIGKVIAVRGRTVDVIVSKAKNTSILLYEGEIINNVSVGGYIKIGKGFSELVGKIDGEFVIEDKNVAPKSYRSEKDKIRRILNISLLGYFDGGNFKQGIKELPLVDNECFLLKQDELDAVHNFIKPINGIPDLKLRIGRLANETSKSIEIGINSLFASHIGIFGNTGSGKSYTLASLYHKLFCKFKSQENFKANAKFVIIDFNGEYLTTLDIDDVIVEKNYKNIYNLTTKSHSLKKYPISETEIQDNDFWAILLTATEKTQKPFLKRALTNDFFFNHFDSIDRIRFAIGSVIESLIVKKTDKGDILQFLYEVRNALQYKIDLQQLIDDYQVNLQWHSQQEKFYYDGQPQKIFDDNPSFNNLVVRNKINEIHIHLDKISYLEKVRLRIVFQYFNELARFSLNSEHIAPLIKRLRKIEELDRVIEISDVSADKLFDVISLSDVNTEMKKVVPLLICKQIYDKKKSERNPKKYLNIIIDEAHNILSYSSQRESETWKDYRLEMFEEIIKEGRKFGVFLTIASQRPSDISDTIISQLHNYFLHRLINNRDIQAVERTISYLDKVSYEALPILPTGTCVLAGLSAHVPVIIEIDKIDDVNEPRNKTIKPTDYWVDDFSKDNGSTNGYGL